MVTAPRRRFYRGSSMTQLRSLALIGVVSIAAACATGPLPREEPLPVTPARFTAGELRDVDNIIVVTDASGSMYQEGTFPRAKALSTSFLRALPDRSQPARGRRYNVGYIAFGGDEMIRFELASFDRTALIAASERAQIMGQSDGTGGTTPIHTVIEDIGTQLEGRSGRTAVVLFSDGVADDADQAIAAAQAVVDARRESVCFHSVQVGNDEVGGDLLRALAATSSCGSLRNAASIGSTASFGSYAKALVVGATPLPDVAAAPTVRGLCRSKITLRGIEFAHNGSDIDGENSAALDGAVATLSGCPDVNVRIDGFTDTTGTETYNQLLSQKRANAVRDYFVSKGIEGDRLSTRGQGEANPVASNQTRGGRALNRRVELTPIQ